VAGTAPGFGPWWIEWPLPSKTVAEREGVPVYVVLSNEQLAEMVRRRVSKPERVAGRTPGGPGAGGGYHYFTVHDPKERTICAARFRERVLHHALMNVCEPVLERAAVFDSYACRRGKGQLAAVRRAESYARSVNPKGFSILAISRRRLRADVAGHHANIVSRRPPDRLPESNRLVVVVHDE